MLLIDSINRPTRAFIAVSPPVYKLGGESEGWAKARSFFRMARSTANGGSLTVLATLRIETGDRLDDLILDRFVATGDWQLRLDPHLAVRGVWPRVDVNCSGSKCDEQLLSADELQRVRLFRRALADLLSGEATD